MSRTMQKPVLVLNKGWTPVGTVSVQRAIVMVFSDYKDGTPKAKIIEPESYAAMTWDDWSKLKPRVDDEVIKAANVVFRCPELIMLTRYDKVPGLKEHFSRRTLYKRDRHQCGYCGCKPGTESLSIDHIIPRSRGGLTTWENCIVCCIPCNAKKANRTPAEAGMKLRTIPVKPKIHLFKDNMKPVKSWQDFIDTCYWEVPLQD
jgi:5-methylcytosine-specific restriction endonuclease McrA